GNGRLRARIVDISVSAIREVAAKLGKSRQSLPRRACERPDLFPFLSSEEDQFALLETAEGNRTAQAPAVVIEAQFGLHWREIILRIQSVIAYGFKKATMKAIPAALGHHVDGRPGVPPILSRERRGLHSDLLDKI